MLLTGAALWAGCAPGDGGAGSRVDDGADPLGGAELMETVEALADPLYRGRLSGQAGHLRAAEWAAARLGSWGVEPGGTDGYFHWVTLETNEIERCRFETPGLEMLELGRDYACRGFTGSAEVEAEVVFAGYGISAPELGWDDYAGLDVAGRIVLVLKGNPPFAPPADEDGGWGSRGLPRHTAVVAAEHGAKGVLLVTPPGNRLGDAPIGSVMHGPGDQPEAMPQIHVSHAIANHLLGDTGQTLETLSELVSAGTTPQSLETGAVARMNVTAHYRPEAKSPNVVGILRGSDPELADEWVVLGAHLDHVGAQEDVIYPGANDNASGAAAVLGAAHEFSRAASRPGRSVAFVLFTAEEQGLYGAKAVLEDELFDADRIVAMLNLDCVCHGDGIQIGSGKANPVLWNLAREEGSALASVLVEETWYGGGADAQPFFDAGVPTLYFAAKNAYTHLHQPTDIPGTCRPDLLSDTAQLVYLTARAIAEGKYEREPRAPRAQ